MARVLGLYYSGFDHIEQMADAAVKGARAAGATVDISRVPEPMPEEQAREKGFKVDRAAPVATIGELAGYNAIVVGTGTRFGRMSAAMAAFLDQGGGLWTSDALVGKAGAAFSSTASQHGGQETTLFSIITNLLHFGMMIVGLDYGYKPQMTLDGVQGGAPHGATTIAGGDGSTSPRR